MSVPEAMAKPYMDMLSSIEDDSRHSAQGYFEAAKSAQFWGKLIVFLPAIVSAAAGVLVALDFSHAWGVASAVAGVISATASFLGAERDAPSFRDSARKYTQLRHEATLAANLALQSESVDELATTVQGLQAKYNGIVANDQPMPNRLYERARNRIKSGVA